MAFVRAAAGRFRAKTRDPAGSGQAAPPEASLGATGPTPDISGLLHRVPGVVSRGTGSSPRHPEVRSFSRGPHLPARLPPRQRQSAREELGTWAEMRGGPGFRARWGGPGRAGPTPRDRVSLGVSGLRPAWGAKSLSWLKRPHPAPRRKTWTETLLLSKVWAELCEKGLCALRPGSHRARTPPAREGIRGLWSLVSAKGIHLRRTWAQVSGTRPHGRSLWRPLEPRGPGLGIFPGALLGPRRPLSPGECPRRPLTPAGRLHPAISGPPRPWSWDTWGRGASNWPTWLQTRRPLRPVPTTAKIPLFFHP